MLCYSMIADSATIYIAVLRKVGIKKHNSEHSNVKSYYG